MKFSPRFWFCCFSQEGSENQERLKCSQIDYGLSCWSLRSGSPEECVSRFQMLLSQTWGVSSVLFSLKSELNESPEVHRIWTLLSSVWFNPHLTNVWPRLPQWELRGGDMVVIGRFWNHPSYSWLDNKQPCCLYHSVYINSFSYSPRSRLRSTRLDIA